MVPVHRHVHGHVHGHARKNRSLLGQTKVLIAQIRAPTTTRGQQHLRVVEMLLGVVLFGRALPRMHHGVFQRQQHVRHVRGRLFLVAKQQRVLVLVVLLCST